MTRGGYRPGAGRKPTPDKKRMVSLRLAQWAVDWLKRQPNQAKAVEQLIAKETTAPKR